MVVSDNVFTVSHFTLPYKVATINTANKLAEEENKL
jgi:hypothetical protein